VHTLLLTENSIFWWELNSQILLIKQCCKLLHQKEEKMKKHFLIMLVVIVGLSLTGVVSAADKDAIKAQVDEIAMMDNGEEVVSTFEELAYVFRSKPNEALLPKAEEFCETAPFETELFNGLDFYSITTKGRDGSVVNWARTKVGEALACVTTVGPDLRPGEGLAYFQLNLGSRHPTTLVTSGLCQLMAFDTPEPGIFPMVCYLNVISAPPEYVGGLLTANSLLGTVTELGYKAASIATIRIFKERDADGFIEDDEDEDDDYDE
jgi:hypothetical protein